MAKVDLFDTSLVAAGFAVPLVYAQGQLGWFTLSVVEVMVILMGVGFILRARREKLPLLPSTADILFLALVVWAGLSLPRAVNLNASLREFLWLLEGALVFYMVSHGVRGRKSFDPLLRAWSYGAALVAALGLLQYYFFVQQGTPRSIFFGLLNPNHLAGYLILFLPLLIACKYGKAWHQRYYWGILSTVVSTALVLTYTRGGWYAAIIALVVMALLVDRRLLGFIIIYILIYSLTVPGVALRAASGLDPEQIAASNDVARLQLWQVGLKMGQENLLTGVGIGNYLELHDPYLERYPELDRGFPAMNPHNSYIKFLAETGLVGLGLALALLLTLARQAWGLWRRVRGRPLAGLTAGLGCGVLAFLLQCNTNSLLHLPRAAFGAWLLFGLVSRMARAELPLRYPAKSTAAFRPPAALRQGD